jgi:hypothetical protein
MILIGCTPPGRHTEQHDVYFDIGYNLKELVPRMQAFWPEAKGKIHLDGWREINEVDGCRVKVVLKETPVTASDLKLFFLNLGGYKENEFEEFHYKMVVAGKDKGVAVNKAKTTAFYKHTGFKGAESHIDDKYGVDVDDIFEIADILPAAIKERYRLVIEPANDLPPDIINLGYFKIDKL